ncbi:uncharacterized protein LOC131008490 [Salvia miltiorrhiza]|uniref:uncharacterized protein LOC131008490 n=1 Tax=Salvia miltiorrhiza TaxID=226208 RepID=UPI0025AD05D7|nr:uncharacterized protein LOC131008490 [Salvia miltiorrhiza]
MGKWEGEGWEWDLKWRRDLREREKEMVNELMSVIGGFSPCFDYRDGWKWCGTTDGVFSTKAAYEECAKAKGVQSTEYAEEIAQIWSALVPHKARVTAWRVVCNRLPTCHNLIKRRVPIGEEEKGCNACMTREETNDHIFLHCPKTDLVWDQIQHWIKTETAKTKSIVDHFKSFIGVGKGKNNRKFLLALWIGTIWLMWKYRNDSRWENKHWGVLSLVNDIKSRMWSWNRLYHIVEANVPFSMWCSNEYSPLA